jgi:hypothetical protein
MQAVAPAQSIARQLLMALVMALSFEQCMLFAWFVQFCLHCIATCSPRLPASGVHASTLSQTFWQVAAALLPLLPPQPCMLPAATASDAKTPTNNAVSFLDIRASPRVV